MSSSKLMLYCDELSAPVRAVLLTLEALGVQYDIKVINFYEGEHLKPEYVKKNPKQLLPALEDGEDMIFDSHAICVHLVNKYGKDDSLYPNDAEKRDLVDQRLHFEAVVRPFIKESAKEIPKEIIAEIHKAYATLEAYLGEQLYVAGDKLTIADFSIATTVSSLHLSFVAVEAKKYPKVVAWLERLATLPYYKKVNLIGANAFKECVKSFVSHKTSDSLWRKAISGVRNAK